MIKFRWRYLVILVFLLLFVAVASFFVYQFVFGEASFSRQTDTTDSALRRVAVSSPDIPVNLFKISSQQEKSIVKQARQDAIAAALASGQNNKKAQQFGKIAAAAALKVISHSPVVDVGF
ncbi:hypothetical protein [Bartonella schoenbuchensis]|uniref:Uncharacterized protein n=1 Tax=Bartonella schoenbuchensis (strain DSM 13525 / NCTC 13165 / R1) TaxID=687861 RepID=E6Z054_BARSR|nr:hypothetical protein [Bartonella schoenbuchensis]AQX30957.1 hypothetical protein BscR1v2_010310 [Bartonella schoenbuchensis R1]CBI82492.1 conserved exported hypothetical protein [Bartonella schoenbuchensis R1]